MNTGVLVMKNKIVYLLCFVFLVFTMNFMHVNADGVVASSEISVIGAQVRTTGNAGIRFVGEIGDLDTSYIKKYGVMVAFGDVEINDDFVLGGKINDKEILNAEVSSLTNNGQFFITLYNIPESDYSQDITARAYVVTKDDEVIYGEEKTTRS